MFGTKYVCTHSVVRRLLSGNDVIRKITPNNSFFIIFENHRIMGIDHSITNRAANVSLLIIPDTI